MVDEYLTANTPRPIYTEDLCDVLNVSPARLAEALRASWRHPHHFLKLRLMAMVRAALSRRDAAPVTLVRSVALDPGFWHHGQVARDYRAMYGESPCETLAHVRGVQPAAESVIVAR
jgi:AraC family ethanolamine operon transcriptional activator